MRMSTLWKPRLSSKLFVNCFDMSVYIFPRALCYHYVQPKFGNCAGQMQVCGERNYTFPSLYCRTVAFEMVIRLCHCQTSLGTQFRVTNSDIENYVSLQMCDDIKTLIIFSSSSNFLKFNNFKHTGRFFEAVSI